jgi:hypothetical protein
MLVQLLIQAFVRSVYLDGSLDLFLALLHLGLQLSNVILKLLGVLLISMFVFRFLILNFAEKLLQVWLLLLRGFLRFLKG